VNKSREYDGEDLECGEFARDDRLVNHIGFGEYEINFHLTLAVEAAERLSCHGLILLMFEFEA
jgi:hypothetical protein